MFSRETGAWAKIGFGDTGVDARAGVLIIGWAAHAMWSTFILMVVVISYLAIAQFLGKTPADSIRYIRRGLAGRYIHVRRFNRLLS